MVTIPILFIAGLFLLSIARPAGACSFQISFGDGADNSYTGVERPFNVAAGATTTCIVDCASGSRATLLLLYGGEPTLFDYDETDFNPNQCDLSLTLTSSKEQFALGWRVNVATSYVGLSLSCTCSLEGDGIPDNPDEKPSSDDGFIGCFSDTSTVQVLNQGVVPMKDLVVGDKVLTGNNKYQPIYTFGHKEAAVEHEFLRIQTDSDERPLEMTPDHLVFVVNAKSGAQEAMRADAIKVGAKLATASSSMGVVVTKIATILKQGAYMPLTPDGTIVVDGIKASTYVSIEEQSPSILSLRSYFGNMSEQTIFHWWLSPLRMLCMGVSSKFCNAPKDPADDQAILTWLLKGRETLMFGEKQNIFVQVFTVALPAFVLFGCLNLVEFVLGPTLAPAAILLMSAYLLLFRRSNCGQLLGATKKQA